MKDTGPDPQAGHSISILIHQQRRHLKLIMGAASESHNFST